jgi:hypothetical protein
MQTRPSPPKKRGIPAVLVVVPLVIVALVVFAIGLNWFIRSGIGFRSIETREAEKPSPKHKAYSVNLYIQSNVGGADVYINGEKQASEVRSSDMKASIFGLRPGKYEIRLKKEGYQDAVRTVELTGDKAVQTIIMEMEANP